MSPEQLAETWKRHSSRLLLIARAIGGPAEDAVQEAFLQLAEQDPCPADPMAWLVTVTRNRLLQWRRGDERRRRREERSGAATWLTHDQPHLDEALDAQRVTETLQAVAEDQRQVIVMHLWGGLSFDKIAEVVGCSRSTAHRTFQSGIRNMRRRLEPPAESTSGPTAESLTEPIAESHQR